MMQPSRKIKHLIVEDEHEFDSAVNANGFVVGVASQFAELQHILPLTFLL